MSADARFPIGRFAWPGAVSVEDRSGHISRIESAPARLREAVSGLSESQLDTPYREGGWTLRQVVHHVPESHMNSYIRFKLALTEPEPTIKPYDEDAWARLADIAVTPVETSLALLESLHARWINLLRGMTETDWKRNFIHHEIGPVSLEKNLALYAWHGDHHIAHVTGLRGRLNW
ncbi:MAG TPA: bacillithiol transferase BstA [Bryobacteraceae bacterium]|nr:bacillithiol transferase BstA [Bryobacteraceae bacterium]